MSVFSINALFIVSFRFSVFIEFDNNMNFLFADFRTKYKGIARGIVKLIEICQDM